MNNEQKLEEDNRIVTGSSWMTLGSLASRILGAIYIMPWMMWMGTATEANAAHALFQVGYTPYAFFISLATAGVPAAISKQVSYFNAIEEYEVSKKIYRQGTALMVITGLISSVLLYLLAPLLASNSPVADKASAVLVIRSLVPALLIIPMQSVVRGLFQGHNRMREPAISQIIEQFARVIFILGSAYILRQVLSSDIVTAVSYSTFAAFIGAVFSVIYLVFRMRQIPTALNRELEESKNLVQISTPELFKDILKTSIPFVIMGTGLNMLQLIDQQTFDPIMNFLNPALSDESIQISYGIIQGNAYKLSTIITSFGASLAITSVPLMSDLIAKEDYKELSHQLEQAIQLLMFIMVPAIIGMFAVAGPFYSFFYTYDPFGIQVTRLYAITSLFLGLFMLLGNIILSINLRRLGIYSLFAGLAVKLITQPLFLWLIGDAGMLVSTIAGLSVIIFFMLKIMHKRVGFSIQFLFRRTLLIFILSIIMGLAAYGTNMGLSLFINVHSRLQALIALIITGGIGAAVYGYLVLKTRLAEKIIGSKAKEFRLKLKIK